MYRKNVNRSNKPKKTMKKGMTDVLLAFTLIIGSFAIPSAPDSSNPTVTVVEAAAKKDKKKPVIKFSGKTNITVEKNEVVKIPKTTAKDNKDGNVTKKISVTVKKGKTSYKSIATKIKNNKKVKFSSTGKYTVTYTVKDKAGNKATKKRYVTVVDSKKVDTSDETTQTTTQQTSEATTQATTEEVTTEAITEEKTTETPTTQTPADRPSSGIYQEIVNGITYNITRDYGIFLNEISKAPLESDEIQITIENHYDYLCMSPSVNPNGTTQYLKFLGSIKATDKNGKDITDNIIIYESTTFHKVALGPIVIYVKDEYGNSLRIHITIDIRDFNYAYNDIDEFELISSDPIIYVKRHVSTKD